MIKYFLCMAAVLMLFSVAFVSNVNAQSDSEKAAQRTEKFRQKIKALGTGEKVKIVVNLFDGSKHKGYVRESNDTSFTVVDKAGNAKTINYSEVKNYSKAEKFPALAAGIVLGAAAGGALVTFLVLRSLGG